MSLCPICGKGKLKRITEKHIISGVNLGSYRTEKCNFCDETFVSGSVMEKIESAAKRKGIWGKNRKKAKKKNTQLKMDKDWLTYETPEYKRIKQIIQELRQIFH